MKMFSILALSAVLMSPLAQASSKQVACRIMSEVNEQSQADAVVSFSVAGVGNCESAQKEVAVKGTALTLSVAFAANCTGRGNPGSYSEHLSSVALSGPKGSSIYSRAFSLGHDSLKSSLQQNAKIDDVVSNVIVHCEAK